MRTVSRPLRSTLALAILLSLLVAGWNFLVQPLIDLSHDRREEIAGLSDQLSRLQAIIAREPELARRAAAEQAALQVEGGLWPGTSPAEVAASMQDQLRRAVADAAGRVRSTALASEAKEHGFYRVTAHFSIEGTLETLQATLGASENARPALFLETLAVHTNGAGDADKPPALTMELDVSGYMRSPNS
jgi:hypothetical protein